MLLDCLGPRGRSTTQILQEPSAKPPGAILLLPEYVDDLLLFLGVLTCVFSLGGFPKKEKAFSL